jgi:hypothetical protein
MTTLEEPSRKFKFAKGAARFPILEEYPDDWDRDQLFLFMKEEKAPIDGSPSANLDLKLFYSMEALREFMSYRQYEEFKKFMIAKRTSKKKLDEFYKN